MTDPGRRRAATATSPRSDGEPARLDAIRAALDEAFRGRSDPVEIRAIACGIVGEGLRTDRAYYVALDEERGIATVARDHVRGDLASLAGEYEIASFSAVVERARRGLTVVVEDASLDPGIRDEDRPVYLGLRLVAFVTVPVIHDGILVAAFCVTDETPRAWTPEEVALLEDVADLTREAALEEAIASRVAVPVDAVPVDDPRPAGTDGDGAADDDPPGDMPEATVDLGVLEAGPGLEIALRLAPDEDPASHRWIDLLLSPVREEGGRQVRRIVGVRDATAMHQARASLAARVRELDELQRIAGLGSWRRDLVADSTTWSAEMFRLFGVDPSGPPLGPAELDARLTPESRERRGAAAAESARTGKPMEVELEIQALDGVTRWLLMRGVVDKGRDGSVVGYHGTALDISRIKRAEIALAERERELSEAQAIAHVGSWTWVAGSGQTWSDEMYRIHGLAPGDPVPTLEAYAKFLPTPDEAPLIEAFRMAIEEGRETSLDGSLRRPDGEIRQVLVRAVPVRDQTGTIVGSRGVIVDVTEERRALLAAQDARRDLGEAQRIAGVGSWRLDLRTGDLQWSEELLRLHGLPPGSTPPSQSERTRFVPEEALARQNALAEACIRSGEPFEIEYDLTDALGTQRRVHSHVEAVRDAHGKIVGLRGTMADISIAHERQEARARRVALHAEDLARIEHSLRTNLSVVEGWAELLGDAEGSLSQQERATAIAAIGRNARAVIEQLRRLTDATVQNGNAVLLDLEPVDLAALAAGVAADYAGMPGVSRIVAKPAVGVLALASRDELVTIVRHLIDNAVEHAGPRANISIRTKRLGEGLVELRVRDRGPGLPEGIDLFAPLGKRSSGGNGLGLNVVRSLVEGLGGTVTGRTRTDAPGAEFIVTLRACPDEEATAAAR